MYQRTVDPNMRITDMTAKTATYRFDKTMAQFPHRNVTICTQWFLTPHRSYDKRTSLVIIGVFKRRYKPSCDLHFGHL